MRFSLKLLASLVLISTFTSGQASIILPSNRCQATLNDATTVASQLQQRYFNNFTGGYTTGGLWTDANTIEDLHNLMLATNSNTWANYIDQSYIGVAVLNPSTDWNLFFGGSYDEAQWMILALWKIADYKAARGLNNYAWFVSAMNIYKLVVDHWDGICGGGVWKTSAHNYKDAITNELFLLTSAEAYLRYYRDVYLNNAKIAWTWLKASGMRGPNGLFNDGLDVGTCKNNGGTTWTYNQGVVASGLGALYAITRDSSLLHEAQITLDATAAHLTSDLILKESCDDASSSSCNHDQAMFKGIWTKHLQYYLDYANDTGLSARYSGFLGTQHLAAMHYGKNASNDIGSVWYAPDLGGSLWGLQASTSGLAAIIAAAEYGPC